MPARLPILILLLVLLSASCQRKTDDSGTSKNRIMPSAAVAPSKVTPGSRPVHPYSIVSGGVSTPEEMAHAVKSDKVVREHYAGLLPASFKAEKLRTDRQGYVSYRIRDKVFWTKRMMTLKRGEVVLTDGATMIRGRCGNRVSEIPMGPVAVEGDEPEEVVLDSFQEEKLLAGIPPVPEASPVGGTLTFTRYPEVSNPDSLLVSPGSSYGLIVEPSNIAPLGVILGPSGSGGGTGGGGGGTFSGGGIISGPPIPVGPFAPASLPYLTAYVPPALTPILPPIGPYGTPQPYLPERPTLPPTSMVVPPIPTPSSFPQPPTLPPVSPPLTPPETPFGPPITVPPEPPSGPPAVPPPTVPPGSSSPPPFSPPLVMDPAPPQDTSVPEPSTFLLVAGAVAAYGASRYFAKR